MAKKNKSSKKHRFKYAEPTGVAARSAAAAPAVAEQPMAAATAVAPSTAAGPSSSSRAQAASSAVVTSRDFSYVTADVRQLSVLAVGLVVLELGLWYLFGHTGLGDAVYNLIHI